MHNAGCQMTADNRAMPGIARRRAADGEALFPCLVGGLGDSLPQIRPCTRSPLATWPRPVASVAPGERCRYVGGQRYGTIAHEAAVQPTHLRVIRCAQALLLGTASTEAERQRAGSEGVSTRR